MGSRYDEDPPESVSSGLAAAVRRSPIRGRWLILIIALMVAAAILAIFGLIITTGGREFTIEPDPNAAAPGSSAPTTQQQPAPDPDAPVRWLISGDGSAMYTIEVGPDANGPLRVLEDATAVGTYEWSGSNLTMAFTRTVTMTDGTPIDDSWTFVCAGAPVDQTLTCTGSKYDWLYDPVAGLDPGEEVTFDVTATRQ